MWNGIQGSHPCFAFPFVCLFACFENNGNDGRMDVIEGWFFGKRPAPLSSAICGTGRGPI